MPALHPRLSATFLCILAVAAGIVSGIWWRQFHKAADQGKSARISLANAPANPDALQRSKTAAETTSAASELAALLDAAPGTETWLRLMALVEKASAGELPGILSSVRGNPTAALMVAARWGEIAPQEMLLALQISEQGKGVLTDFGIDINEFMDAAVLSWLERDPSAATNAMVRMGSEKDCQRTVRTFFGVRLFDHDPSTAIPIMRKWGDTNFNGRALRNWAQKDFPAAARLLATLGDNGKVHEGLGIIAQMMAEKDPKAALALAATLPPGGRADLFAQHAASAWALHDPSAAAAAVADLSPAQKKAIGPGLVHIMAIKDPAAALEWTLTNFHGKTRLEAISAIALQVGVNHAGQATEFLEQFDTRPLRQAATQGIFDGITNKVSPSEAVAWLLRDSDSTIAADVFYRWREEGRTLDSKTADTILQHLPDGPAGEKIVAATIYSLEGGLRSGLAWAARLPATHQPAAYQRLMQDWGTSEPAVAREFTASLPPGPARDAAVHELARQAPTHEEAATTQWLQSLPLPDRATAIRALKTNEKPGLPSIPTTEALSTTTTIRQRLLDALR